MVLHGDDDLDLDISYIKVCAMILLKRLEWE
jgi:hypothetical protein